MTNNIFYMKFVSNFYHSHSLTHFPRCLWGFIIIVFQPHFVLLHMIYLHFSKWSCRYIDGLKLTSTCYFQWIFERLDILRYGVLQSFSLPFSLKMQLWFQSGTFWALQGREETGGGESWAKYRMNLTFLFLLPWTWLYGSTNGALSFNFSVHFIFMMIQIHFFSTFWPNFTHTVCYLLLKMRFRHQKFELD